MGFLTMVCLCVQSVEQVAFADIILLNKSDLVTEEDKKRITARIKVLKSLFSLLFTLWQAPSFMHIAAYSCCRSRNCSLV